MMFIINFTMLNNPKDAVYNLVLILKKEGF